MYRFRGPFVVHVVCVWVTCALFSHRPNQGTTGSFLCQSENRNTQLTQSTLTHPPFGQYVCFVSNGIWLFGLVSTIRHHTMNLILSPLFVIPIWLNQKCRQNWPRCVGWCSVSQCVENLMNNLLAQLGSGTHTHTANWQIWTLKKREEHHFCGRWLLSFWRHFFPLFPIVACVMSSAEQWTAWNVTTWWLHLLCLLIVRFI